MEQTKTRPPNLVESWQTMLGQVTQQFVDAGLIAEPEPPPEPTRWELFWESAGDRARGVTYFVALPFLSLARGVIEGLRKAWNDA